MVKKVYRGMSPNGCFPTCFYVLSVIYGCCPINGDVAHHLITSNRIKPSFISVNWRGRNMKSTAKASNFVKETQLSVL